MSTKEKGEEEKDNIFEELTCTINEIPRYDIKILIGDISAKIVREEIFRETSCGYIKLKRNYANRICNRESIKIKITEFQRKHIYKSTWVSPNGNYCNPNNHV